MFSRIRRFLFVALLFGLLVVGLGAWFAYTHYTDPATIRRLALKYAGGVFHGGQVQLDAVDGRLFGGLRFRQFLVKSPTEEGGFDEFMKLPECILYPDRDQLLDGRLAVRKVIVRDATVHLHRRTDGTWNFSRWFRDRVLRLSYRTEIKVLNATVQFSSANPAAPALELAGIDLEMELHPPNIVTFETTCKHLCSDAIRIKGRYDLETRRTELELSTQDPIDLARLATAIPMSKIRQLVPVGDVRGFVNLRFSGSVGMGNDGFEWDGVLVGELSDGALSHTNLPYPVRNAVAVFTASPGGLEISRFEFDFGPAKGRLSGTIPDFDFGRAKGGGSLNGLEFTDRLYASLPIRQRQLWERFLPEGAFNAEVNLDDGPKGQTWTAAAELRNDSVSFHLFPYRVTGIGGRVILKPNGHLVIDTHGNAGGVPVSLVGTVFGIERGAPVALEVDGKQFPLDQRFLDALPENARRIADKFAARGTADFHADIKRGKGNHKFDVKIDADVQLASCVCAWFPYRLENVTGHLEVRGPKTVFTGFRGESNGTTVKANGEAIKSTEGVHVQLDVDGDHMPLDEKLLAALPLTWKRTWDSLRPGGTLKRFSYHSLREPGMEPYVFFDLELDRGVIEPEAFPYRMQNLRGAITYNNGSVSWCELRGEHGLAVVECSGVADSARIAITDLTCKRLPFDADLRRALPLDAQKVFDFLRPSRPVAVEFRKIEVQRRRDATEHPIVSYDGGMSFADTDMIPSINAKRVTGNVSIVGSCDGQASNNQGSLELESITVSGFNARNVLARIVGNGRSIGLLDIEGEFYGGRLTGAIQGTCGPVPSYLCKLETQDASLREYVQRSMTQPVPINGRVRADVTLFGQGDDIDKLNGSGELHMSNADIYQLPILVDVFRLLYFQAPNGQVFDDVDSKFYFKDREIRIQYLNLTGVPFSLHSPEHQEAGHLNLDTLGIDLRLRPRWARGRLRIPPFSQLLNGVSDQAVTVRVTGALPAPKVKAEPVPGLLQMLKEPVRRLNKHNQDSQQR